MSITLRTEITLTARIVLSTAMVADIEAERVKMRAMVEKEAEKYAALVGNKRRLTDLFIGDLSTEELFKVLFRQGFREFSKDGLAKELEQEGLKFDRVQAKVSFDE